MALILKARGFADAKGRRPGAWARMHYSVPVFWFCAVAVLALGSCGSSDKPAPSPATSESPSTAPPTKRVVGPLSAADAAALATMNDRLREYIDLHTKIERSLPKLPKEAT